MFHDTFPTIPSYSNPLTRPTCSPQLSFHMALMALPFHMALMALYCSHTDCFSAAYSCLYMWPPGLFNAAFSCLSIWPFRLFMLTLIINLMALRPTPSPLNFYLLQIFFKNQLITTAAQPTTALLRARRFRSGWVGSKSRGNCKSSPDSPVRPLKSGPPVSPACPL